jgi:hypothetical protein
MFSLSQGIDSMAVTGIYEKVKPANALDGDHTARPYPIRSADQGGVLGGDLAPLVVPKL